MELVTPSIGLLFWMCLSFGIVVFLLKKYAWKPILTSIKQREQGIEDALNEAKKMREEIASLKAGNEALMAQAREEREVLLKEARDVRDREIAEAKNRAKTEAESILGRARAEIQNEKKAAVAEIKILVGELSVEIAEKILREKLAADEAQRALVDRMLKDAEKRLS
jgi:F-type H+-transporting ATPase subunit b